MKPAFPQHHPTLVNLVLEFARQHRLLSAHYWGYADRGLIESLKIEPAFEFGVSDEYERWLSGLNFWGGDGIDISAEEYRTPAWLEGVRMFQEGMHDTHFLIYDLSSEVVQDEDRLDHLISERDITHIALLRPEAMQSTKAADFAWTHTDGIWFGVRRQPTEPNSPQREPNTQHDPLP
jgi:hypothetical protein